MQSPQRLAKRATTVWTPEHELSHSNVGLGICMQRSLNWLDLVGLGIGGMVGAGVFVTAGVAANSRAGPAVILSFLIAGFAALLSAFCYAEFAVEIPTAGGAFSYLGISLGEFAAFITGANVVLEYVISNAAVARTFTAYMASSVGYSPESWRVEVPGIWEGSYSLDFLALALVSLLTLSICYSTKRSSNLNMAVTLVHIVLILMVVAAGFVNGKLENLVRVGSPDHRAGFLPFGVNGIFDGAAIVYFSFIGFDAISTMAEEVKYPAKNMPIGIAGSVLLVTLLYTAMAGALCMLLPYDKIDVKAPFASALKEVVRPGWKWVGKMVQVGACLGILSSLLVAMLGQARYLCAISRSRLIPFWLAKVDDMSSTPLRSSLLLGVVTGTFALVVDTAALLDLISIGTLFVFYMVSNALIFRRHVLAGVTNPFPTAVFLASATALSLSFVAFWRLGTCHLCRTIGLSCSISALLAATLAFWAFVPCVDRPVKLSWQAPFMPWLAVLSIFVNVFLAGSLGSQAYYRFGAWSLLALLFYVGYGVHSAHDAEEEATRPHS